MVSQTVSPGAAFQALSPNEAVQFILGDIPIFTVGILALGTFTFFLLMKRVDRWIFCLHLSLLLSFLAAIFDLSQLLIQGRVDSTDGTAVSADIFNLVKVREVFFAFANGLRFLFYWGFVAMIPLGETIPEGNLMHSGSWRRWGIIGAVLKWTTLVFIALVVILQLVYRNVPALEQIGPTYEAEAMFEIILSAVFILKLLLNTWARYPVNFTTQSKGKVLVQYAPMIVALLFSLWIAIGNVILFEFTETALGRFMRAVELYVVVVYMLTISFYHLRHLSFFPVYRPAPKSIPGANTFQRDSMEKRDSDFPPLNAETTRINLSEVIEEQYRAAQQVPPTVERNSARSAQVQSANQHQSMAGRLSTWLGATRPLPRLQDNVQPWDVDAERGPSPVAQTATQPWYAEEKPQLDALAVPVQPVLDEDEQRGVSPLPDFPPRTLQMNLREPSMSSANAEQGHSPAVEVASMKSAKTSVPDRDWQEIEYSNANRYSGVDDDVVADALKQKYYQYENESPITTNIQVVSPHSDGSLRQGADSRPQSLEGGQNLASPYPMSPLASAVATPVPRSRPLPPMPVARRMSYLNSPTSPMPDSARSSNMSVLLRQQNELDKSIAALRFFNDSPSQREFDSDASMSMSDEALGQTLAYVFPPEGQQTAGYSPLATAVAREFVPSPDLTTPGPDRIPQSSSQSEFHFDHQPPLNRSSMDSAVIPAMPVQEKAVARAESPKRELAIPKMPTSRFSDASSVGSRRERKGIDSMGTQYDITSFVGNLTVPANPKDSMMSATSAGGMSEEGFVGVATVARPGFAQLTRPTFISSQLSRQEGIPSFNSGLPSNPSPIRAGRALPQPPQAQPQPQPQTQTQQPSQSQPAPSAQPTTPPTIPRFRRGVGLPPRPRLSGSSLTPVDEKEKGTSPTDTL